ncbi:MULTISPECIES: lytic transglycosylase domain-containing protein [unclassified Rhizobium]|uniref:lytic transglycosylase domain-containing protein n=1 Tax=unclassified Rhizobium TaxID=2613769 RepID=UPI00160B1FCB|nr:MULTISPECIES: lytic transglycosylase domain-containing protein [unclassified Rhizobium]MBB3386268.1 soluble lytic murein transglycosylase-like protein [Rhizobium sp. BK098]MBB3617972.1 soluble lytic murein transglycosylase-like protein [Rhizobium sp. BK609]MBB3683575.1 soluble lytic murein transglycosylase-like protein [Rhizobium sp. BK612]
MDSVPLSPMNRPHKISSRSVLWLAGTSAFLLTGFASGPDDSSGYIVAGQLTQVGHAASRMELKADEVAAMPPNPKTSAAASTLDIPTIDSASFNDRFSGPVTDALRISARPSEFIGGFSDNVGRSESAAESRNDRRERGVHSLVSVYSFEQATAVPELSEPATAPYINAARTQARPDLLSGVPTDYASLALKVAGEEEVDPNWVLSVMRAENAAFDPDLVSSAGAIGLMQVMPRIGEAFGATDLTDPQQSIRAGTRFLRVLIAKYRNPVLVAAAYNAGEPNVDLRHSLPLIRETADYVTRVVGYYTGTTANPSIPRADSPSEFVPSSKRRTGPAERAKSPMLVFSAATPSPPEVRPQRDEARKDTRGPVKIVKEEVSQ